MEKYFIKLLFLSFLYFSNISTAIFIYPLIYFILGANNAQIKWYNFGIIFSVYEFGKFFGLFLWDFCSHKYSNIILIIISLFFIFILNISYITSFNIYHIFIIRLLSGFFNNIGKYSKDIYIQLGLKEKLQSTIFFISIICTLISIFLPSIIIQIIFNKNDSINNNNIKQIFQITLIFSVINILTIILSLILINNKTLKYRKTLNNFIQMNSRLEKLEYSRNKDNTKIPQSTAEYNRSSDIKYTKKKIALKINKENRYNDNQNSGQNTNNYFGEKMTSNRYIIINKKEEESKMDKRNSLNLFSRSKNNETGAKVINQPPDLKINQSNQNNSKIIKNNKKIKYCFIYSINEISDSLSLIWTLTILHIEFKGNCLHISLVYASIRLLGEIISFPINTIIIKKTNYYSQYQIKKNISKFILIMNIFLFIITIIFNLSIFFYYYHWNNKFLLYVIFFVALIRNISSIIIIQLFKIYLAKDFNVQSNNMILLRKYKQYSGYLVKTIFFLVGSYGYNLIDNASNNNFNYSSKDLFMFSNIVFVLYFIAFPSAINIILILSCKYFI